MMAAKYITPNSITSTGETIKDVTDYIFEKAESLVEAGKKE